MLHVARQIERRFGRAVIPALLVLSALAACVGVALLLLR